MRKTQVGILILCFFIAGCWSIPRAKRFEQVTSLSRQEKTTKGSLGKKTKTILFIDFRGNQMREENLAALKKKVEHYIDSHEDLTDTRKNNLRELKISDGATKEEVLLLLGEADKISKTNTKAATEIWIYRTKRRIVFSVICFPLFFTHEGYYLYFNGEALQKIELHSLEQTFYCGDPESPPGTKTTIF